MLRRGMFFILLVLLVVAAGLTFVAYQFNLSALNEPGRTETYLATKAKLWLVGRSARGPLPPAPPSDSSSGALPEVQQWSDAELFWIIKNGIRLSGMPGFGKIHSDVEIWHLVQYIRSLRAPPKR